MLSRSRMFLLEMTIFAFAIWDISHRLLGAVEDLDSTLSKSSIVFDFLLFQQRSTHNIVVTTPVNSSKVPTPNEGAKISNVDSEVAGEAAINKQ